MTVRARTEGAHGPGGAAGDRDEGTILLLTLGYAVLALALLVVVIDASTVFLARRSLAASCDGASLSAAQVIDSGQVYAGAAGAQLPLGAVQEAVAAYQGQSDPGAQLTARVEDGTTVVVQGARPVRLPVVTWLGIQPVRVVASARASSRRIDPLNRG